MRLIDGTVALKEPSRSLYIPGPLVILAKQVNPEAAERGNVVAIQPPQRVDWVQKNWTDCADLRLARAVADDRGDGFELTEIV